MADELRLETLLYSPITFSFFSGCGHNDSGCLPISTGPKLSFSGFHFISSSFKIHILRMLTLTAQVTTHCCEEQQTEEEKVYLIFMEHHDEQPGQVFKGRLWRKLLILGFPKACSACFLIQHRATCWDYRYPQWTGSFHISHPSREGLETCLQASWMETFSLLNYPLPRWATTR